MFFVNERNIIEDIYTVCKLEWDKTNVLNPGNNRFFNSISIRITGDALIKSDNFSLSVHQGDILVIPKNTSFYRQSNTSEQIIVVHFKSSEIIDIPECFTSRNYEKFLNYFLKLYNIWTAKNHGYFYDAVSTLNRILRDILQEIKQQQLSSNSKEMLLHNIIECISEHFNEKDFTIDELARECHISTVYIRQMFHKFYGISPIEYITKLKIDYATELLNTHYYTIAEVADKCGFQNCKYFSTLYKKKTGISPSKI